MEYDKSKLVSNTIISNMIRDILHFEQHHEKSEGITQYIRNKYERYC